MYQGVSLDQAPPKSIPFRFFYSSVFFLALAGLLLVLKGSLFFDDPASYDTVALVHVFTLGWLMMIMFGAFYQMIPVMIGGKVPLLFLAKPAHFLSVIGTLGLVGFFFHFESYLLWIGGLGLSSGILIFLTQCLVALYQFEGKESATLKAMRASLLSLGGVLALGIYFLGTFAGLWQFFIGEDELKAIHALWGLVGWVGLLIIGVSFHLIPMFYVTPPIDEKRAHHIVDLIILSLVLTPILLAFSYHTLSFALGLIFAFMGLTLYFLWLVEVLRQRRRKRIDAVVRQWWIGSFYLALSLLSLGLVILFPSNNLLFLLGAFWVLGFSLNITLGMLLKIFSFLVWFHKFSGLIGQSGVPMLGDLIEDTEQMQLTNLFNIWLLAFLGSLVFHQSILLQLLGFLLVLLSFATLRLLVKADTFKMPQ
ncbi:MAG: hypothetical protein QNL04_08595 [SAR324 cluster bacterium]|nr:hypothetical protein [SAR324 cluster bacterium]